MKNLDLTKGNINKLLISFSIPCIMCLLINPLYNIIDQVFIGQWMGLLESAATNVIFPLVLIFSAVANLIGNGISTELSLQLKMGRDNDVKKLIGIAISNIFLFSIILSFVTYLILPQLVYWFGSSSNVYSYALDYGRIVVLGIPFMMVYTTLFPIIKTEASLKYAMFMLISGVIINIGLDTIFVVGLHMGVKGCALATLLGQALSFVMTILYIIKRKVVKFKYEYFKPSSTFLHVLPLGLSNFIHQMIIVGIFIFMNNIMTRYGGLSKYGMDIPLAVYGAVSKIDCLFIFFVLGITTGSQSIIGFNYGAGNYDRVKSMVYKVLKINFIIGIIFNLLLIICPELLLKILINKTDSNYYLFMELAILMCRISLSLCCLKFLEITFSLMFQYSERMTKTTLLAFIRPLLLVFFIFLCVLYDKGIYGVLYSILATDIICFLIHVFFFLAEYKKNTYVKKDIKLSVDGSSNNILYSGKRFVITISREYGSGGHYVGKLLAKKLGINFYDDALISMVSKESGLSEWYVEETEQRLVAGKFPDNNDDRLFIAESQVIKKIANKESCVIVGRCADYILKDDPNTIRIFLYSDLESKINRAILYYNVDSSEAEKIIFKINYERAKHYKYYTSREWKDVNNYDLMLNVDLLGIELAVDQIINLVENKQRVGEKRKF